MVAFPNVDTLGERNVFVVRDHCTWLPVVLHGSRAWRPTSLTSLARNAQLRPRKRRFLIGRDWSGITTFRYISCCVHIYLYDCMYELLYSLDFWRRTCWLVTSKATEFVTISTSPLSTDAPPQRRNALLLSWWIHHHHHHHCVQFHFHLLVATKFIIVFRSRVCRSVCTHACHLVAIFATEGEGTKIRRVFDFILAFYFST